MPIYNVEIVYRDVGAAWKSTGTPAPERVNKDGSVKLVPSAEMRVEEASAQLPGSSGHGTPLRPQLPGS